MFGAMINMSWAITYVKNGTVYYLSELSDDGKFVWSTKKDKAKKYMMNTDATKVAESIMKTRKNKKQEINVIQV